MQSLQAIPEPTNNAPPTEPTDVAQHVPLAVATAAPTARPGVTTTTQQPTPDSDQQVDQLAILLVLMIAGTLLRIVLGLLGPLQGIDPTHIQQTQQSGRDILAANSQNPYPLTDLLALGLSTTGLPAWTLVALGSILTLIAIPAAYLIGQTLTGRPAPGIVAAAIVAVHPAVLTAANSYTSPAIALGLITVGLAVLCTLEKRGGVAASIGACLLALAAFAAPLCWLIGVLAGPMTYKLAQRRGTPKALAMGILVTTLAAAPVITYRAVYLNNDASTIFVEWAQASAADTTPTPMHRLLVSMTSPSFQELGQAMHLPLGDAGRLKIAYNTQASSSTDRDVVADTLADGWLLINAALAGLAAISAGVMLARRRFAETLLLAVPLLALAFTTLPPSEALRLPMIALVGVLASGLLATRSVPIIDEAKREAKRIAKLAKREEKERAKQDRELAKHKESLYAFDKPTKPRQKPAAQAKAQLEAEPTPGILTQREEEPPKLSARPI